MRVVTPPTAWSLAAGERSVFLAGSIEQGAATDWQRELVRELAARERAPLVALNPRRPDWDASWRQSIDEPRFREQVEWELAGLERADVIAMWLEPATRAPISLLELGLFARSGKLVVACPDGYWRKGNVEIVCARFAIPRCADWPSFVDAVASRLT